jgi:hypothetical protein
MSEITTASATGLCPKCRVVRNMSVTVERQQATAEDGTVTTTEITTTHCESCGSFVSRSSREVEQDE